jgi:hypothetical protein
LRVDTINAGVAILARVCLIFFGFLSLEDQFVLLGAGALSSIAPSFPGLRVPLSSLSY